MKHIKKIIGFLYCVVFCTVVAVGVPQIARAAEEIAIDETNFPNGTFRNYVKSFDKDNSNGLSEEEIADVKNIDVGSKWIASLRGIEHFTALTYLYCAENSLTSLDVSKNTALITLYCAENSLTSLDVSKNTALTTLECGKNRLTNLDVSKNTALTTLHCPRNQLTSLDVSKNTALTELTCAENQLTSLDVSTNTALTKLYCSGNQLTSLDVNGATALTTLHCYENQLTSLNANGAMALTELYCSGNQLTSLDVNGATALITLYCTENQLTSLDVSTNTALIILFCYSNQLAELKLNSHTYSTLSLYPSSLHLYSNSLTDLQNITETNEGLKVIDITKPATYKVNGKEFTIIYTDTVILPSPEPSMTPTPKPSALPVPSANPIVPSDIHIFSDYNYKTPVSGSAVVIYGNGMNKKINGKKINNKALTVYTDILASYKYTPNNNGTVKTSVGKVIVGITKDNIKPTVNNKNKITDTSASKIAKAKIKNGQITVTAVGKERGLVYLWVIDTGSKGVSAYCPIDIKLAPTKLEVQNTAGSKLTKNTELQNGKTLDVCVAGFVGSTKTKDGTYTATVDSKYQSYITVTSVEGSTDQFIIKAIGLRNNKKTKVTVMFTCNQNNKKTNFSLTFTK